jgi:phosphate transport system substrate-binding protein
MKPKPVVTSLLAVALMAVASTPGVPALAAPQSAGSIQLSGSGATFPQPLYEEWAYIFSNNVDTTVTINYSGGGSGQGKKDILAGTVDFAGSDAPLTNEEAAQKPLVQIPTVAGAVVLAFNLPGIPACETP